MPVDLNQLPIPDWGLRCPTCSYLLKGLPSHRCPECGTQLPMAGLVHVGMHAAADRYTYIPTRAHPTSHTRDADRPG